ncbi:MAG: hypothetical protein GY729_13740 [Desulfobacteraceae bacterium]|nr:hypothetical protein [Desulfobacteraceae bacterium]
MFLNHLSSEQLKCLESLVSVFGETTPGLSDNRIVDTLDRFLLDDEQQQVLGLNPWNIFFLCAAVHLFEIHNSLGHGKSTKALGLLDGKQAKILSLICSLIHEDADQGNTPLEAEPAEYKRQPINIPLISGAIRLAAALDIEYPGTAGNISQNLAKEDRMPFDRFCNSFEIITMGPHPFLSGAIRLRIRCSDAAVHRALKHHETRIQRFLHQANDHVSPRFLFSEIMFEIEPRGYAPLDMKFSVDSMAALKLLTGNRLYSDKRVFLRELVQNAVDACNLNKIFHKNYEPKISIEFDSGYKTIRFRDNGIGMDRQWIEKYFLKVGISFYRSGDLKTIHKSQMDCHFISKFGIGFLSSFLAAHKIVIQTRQNASQGLIITIHTLQDYFDVRFAPDSCGNGTEVTLFLSEDNISFSRSMDYVCYLKNNLRFLAIPVELKDHQGQTVTLGNEKLPYEREDKTGRDFMAPLDFENSEGYLFLKAKENLGRLYALDYARGGVSIFQDGIFVTQVDSLLPEGARQNIIGRINLTGNERCELSMDRNRIFWTEDQLLNIKRHIRLGIVDLANMVMDSAGDSDSSAKIDQSLVNHLAIFFDFNQINDDMYYRLNLPVRKIVAKRFRDFIRISFSHTRDNKHVPEADGYAEQWQQKIIAAFAKKSRPSLPID